MQQQTASFSLSKQRKQVTTAHLLFQVLVATLSVSASRNQGLPFASAFVGKHSSNKLDRFLTSTADSAVNTVDRSTLTLLEHVNLNVPSHEYILPFYLDLLGCGLDPRKAANVEPRALKKTIWANCGASQFHLPYGDAAQVLPGSIGLVYDSLEPLKQRLEQSTSHAQKCFQTYNTQKDSRGLEAITIVDNYNNVFVCRSSAGRNVPMRQPILRPSDTNEWGHIATRYGREESECRGIDYVEFECPQGTAEKIAQFYEAMLDVTTAVVPQPPSKDQTTPTNGKIAMIAIGNIDERGRADQYLLFKETKNDIPPYDGHHVAMYVGETAADFEQAFKNADMAGVVWVNPRFSDDADTLANAKKWNQFRFKTIVDIETGAAIFELEHEMRCIEHESWPGSSPPNDRQTQTG